MNDKGNNGQPRAKRTATTIVTAGRDPKSNYGFVNPPVYHASTVLYPTRRGLCRAPRALPIRPARHPDDGGARTRAAGVGGAAMRRRRAGAVGTGGDFDRAAGGRRMPAITCWSPTAPMGRRARFCDQILARLGVTTTYYDPLIGAGIADLLRAQHPRRLSGIAGLAELRNAGRRGYR